MNRIIQFLREVKVELGKVVWPSRKEALKITVVVILFSLAIALFLGLIDYGLAKLIAILLNR